jgi:hypothetical protein
MIHCGAETLFYCTQNLCHTLALYTYIHMWSDNEVRKLIAVKVLHTSLLNIFVVAFKLLPLGSYAPMPVPSPPFKTILELVLLNGLQSCCCITPDVSSVTKIPSFEYIYIVMCRGDCRLGSDW